MHALRRSLTAIIVILTTALFPAPARSDTPKKLVDIGAVTLSVHKDISDKDNILLGFQSGAPTARNYRKDRPVCFLMLRPEVKSQTFEAGKKLIELTGEVDRSDPSPDGDDVELQVSGDDPALTSVWCRIDYPSGGGKPLTTMDLAVAFGPYIKIYGLVR